MLHKKVVPLILCAGLGSRMRPLTNIVPKPCITFLDKPLFAYSLILLKKWGFSEVGINLYHLSHVAKPIILQWCKELKIIPLILVEEQLSGSGGGIRALYDAFDIHDADFLIMNGDTIIDANLGKLIYLHQKSMNKITMLCVKKPHATSITVRKSSACRGEQNENSPQIISSIRDYGIKTNEGALFTGVQLLSSEIIEQLPINKNQSCYSYKYDLIDSVHGPYIEKNEELMVVWHQGYWASIESPDILEAEMKRLLNGDASLNL